jgi:hypothetical protein
MVSLVVDTSVLLAVLLNEPTRRALVNATEGYSLVGALLTVGDRQCPGGGRSSQAAIRGGRAASF